MAGPTKRCPHANEYDYCGSCITCGEGRRTITVGCASCESCMGIKAAVRALDAQQQQVRPRPPISTADTARLQVLREKIEHDDFEGLHCADPNPDFCREKCDNYVDCFRSDDEGNTPGDGA